MSDKTLDERVLDFQLMRLPGQPMAMHMGTSYLVNDLHAEVKRLRTELADAQSHIVKLQEVWEDTRNQRDALRAIVKEQ
jgi:hypothetical protein